METKYWPFVFLIIFYPFHLNGQVQKLVSIEENEYNNFFAQDSKGFLWISSSHHWNRYDGGVVDTFELPEQHKGEYIQCPLFEDEIGRLWFTTANGIFYFDPQAERIIFLREVLTSESGFNIFYLDQRTQTLWLTAAEEMYLLNTRTFNISSLGVDTKAVRFAIDTFPNGQPRTIVGTRWSKGEGIEVFRRNTPGEAWKQDSVGTSPGKTKYIHAVHTEAGQFYLSSRDGLEAFNARTLQFTTINNLPEILCNYVYFILYDPKKKELYCSLPEKGIGTIAVDTLGVIKPSLFRFKHQSGQAEELFIDNNQNLYVSTPKADIQQISHHDSIFTLNAPTSQNTSFISLQQGPNESIYLADDAGNVWKRNLTTNIWAPLLNDISLNSSIEGMSVSGNYLYLYSSTEVVRFDLNNLQSDKKTLSPPKFIKLAAHQNGAAIVATFGDVTELNFELNKIAKQPDLSQFKWLEFNYFNYLGNNILAGTFNYNSVWVFDWEPPVIQVKKKYDLGKHVLTINRHKASGDILVGTTDGVVEIRKDTLFSLSVPGYIDKSLSVNNIIRLQNQYSLFTTPKGLVLHSTQPDQNKIFRFGENLEGTRFLTDQSAVESDGTVWLLTDEGPIRFHPDDLAESQAHKPSPWINKIWVNNVPISPNKPVRHLSKLTLNYWENNLSFNLRCISMEGYKSTLVRFRLLGSVDNTWKHTQPGKTVSFNHLPYDQLSFEYQPINKNGILGEINTLEIKIKSPFWQRPWFIILLSSGLIAVGVLINHLRTRRKLRQAAFQLRRQQAIANERERIASELHDDLGGDLASMAFIIDGHNSLKELGVDAELDVSRLGQLANGAIKHMREMIWVLDDEQATLPTLAKQLLANAREMAAIGDLSLQADIPEDLPALPLSSIQKKNILLIAKESMQNIRKHAKASAFNLRLAVEQQGEQQILVLNITDNGQGLMASQQDGNETQLNHGHGLKNLHKRATEISATLTLSPALPRGTKVELLVPLN